MEGTLPTMMSSSESSLSEDEAAGVRVRVDVGFVGRDADLEEVLGAGFEVDLNAGLGAGFEAGFKTGFGTGFEAGREAGFGAG